MTASPPDTPEFSHLVSSDALVAGRRIEAAADPAARAALATRFGVPEVRALSFRAEALGWGPGGWRIRGVAEAALTQTCVVTLEPVQTTVAEPFERFYAPPDRLPLAEALVDPELEEAPEAIPAAIDLGEIAAETVALAIDAYPRKPGAAFPGVALGPPGVEPLSDEATRPFARLAALKPPGERR